jgi:hypothetical protein
LVSTGRVFFVDPMVAAIGNMTFVLAAASARAGVLIRD